MRDAALAQIAPLRELVARLVHAVREEQALAHKRLVAFARELLDDRPQQAEVRVLVRVAGPRGEAEGRGEDLAQVLGERDGLVIADIGVGEARRVRQEVVKRDRGLVGGDVGKVAADRVRHAQLRRFLELEDRRGRELLGDRADVGDGPRRPPRPAFAVGQAEAVDEERRFAARHEHHAGKPELLQALKVGSRLGRRRGVSLGSRFGLGGKRGGRGLIRPGGKRGSRRRGSQPGKAPEPEGINSQDPGVHTISIPQMFPAGSRPSGRWLARREPMLKRTEWLRINGRPRAWPPTRSPLRPGPARPN